MSPPPPGDKSPSQAEVEAYELSLEEVRKSMSATREVIEAARAKIANGKIDSKDGISLLTLKCNIMIQYLQSLVLLSAQRLRGSSLQERAPPIEPFSNTNRGPRGIGAGDMLDSVIESEVVLEQIMLMEDKMKHQINKLIEAAKEKPQPSKAPNDPMSFKPNLEALMGQDSGSEGGDEEMHKGDHEAGVDGIYRPPKVAPMPYTEPRKGKDRRPARLPTALTSLSQMDPSMPHMESTSGLGSTPALMSKRAKDLNRMTEFEEENMTRLVMKKKDAKRRKEDEANIALGGTGAAVGRGGRGGGLEDEFGDILRSVGRNRRGAVGDGYEELRQNGRKTSALARSRERSGEEPSEGMDDGPRPRKKSRFELAVKAERRRKVKR